LRLALCRPAPPHRSPAVKWAQREDKIFLTINLTQCKDAKVEILPEGKFSFTGHGGPDQQEYKFELELNGEIDVEGSKRLLNDLKLFFTLAKKESGPYWPRLTKEKVRLHWLKVDFDKWKDEDDDEDDKPADYDMPGMEGMGGMPGMGGGPGGFDMEAMMKQMGGMEGMGGMGGPPGAGDAAEEDEDDAPDSDDEDMPGLE